jgi:hypothetical protein
MENFIQHELHIINLALLTRIQRIEELQKGFVPNIDDEIIMLYCKELDEIKELQKKVVKLMMDRYDIIMAK